MAEDETRASGDGAAAEKPKERMKRLEAERVELEDYVERIVHPFAHQYEPPPPEYDNPVEEAEDRIGAIEREQERLRARIAEDEEMGEQLRVRGKNLADAAEGSRGPQIQALNWTLSGLSGAVLSVSYSFLRTGVDYNARFYLTAAIYAAALAIAAHVFQKLGHVLADHLVISRARSVAVTEDFDDAKAVHEWLDSTTEASTRWHANLPMIGVFTQALLVLVAIFIMLAGITTST